MQTDELPETPPDRVWIEDTKTASHGHGGPGWEFGSWLWSPSSADGGSDYYALMRAPETGDIVIHFNDGSIVGWSRVASSFQDVVEPPPNPAQWAGRPSYYRIALTDYRAFPRSVPVSDFVARNQTAISEDIRTVRPKRYPFILYNEAVRRAQGAYISRCTPKLYALIRDEVYGEEDSEGFDPVTRTWLRRSTVEARVRQKLQLATRNEDVSRAVLEFLAWAIEVADEDRTDGWYVRETQQGLRLMAGRLLACEVRRSRFRVSVLGPVPEEVLEKLGAEIDDEFKWVPGGVIVGMPLDKAGDAHPLLKDAMDGFLDSAMTR